ncbi:MAG: SpaA isopeptide-forming pilin-related protein, partial [Lachnospiraceae bacterium]|nr:SpaA isopeptide-forming pilin-related protein [Lachnospiraceae bacterium]
LTEETETEAASEALTEEMETEAASEFLSIEAETQEESETADTERSTELVAEEEAVEEIINEAELLTWYSDAGAVLKVQMVDADTQAVITGGSIEVKASSPIYGADGTVSYEKGETVASHSWTENDSDVHDIGEDLKFGGSYYMEATVIPEGYLPAARTYFTIDDQGAATFGNSEEWDKNSQELKYQLYPEKTESAGVALITVNGGEKTQNGAAFVVKNEEGKILRDASGSPKYYVTTSKGKAVLEGLPAGTYYLSQIMAAAGYLVAADTKFTVEDGKQTEIPVINNKIPDISNTLTVSMQSMYGDTLLTAEEDHTFYTALFQDKNLTKKATEVKEIVQKTGEQLSEEIVFAGLEAGKTYYLAETDEFGAALQNGVGQETEVPYVSDFAQLTGETQKSITYVKYQTVQNAETDSMTEGQAVQSETGSAGETSAGTGQAAVPEEKTVTLLHRYKEYPDGEFSYMAEIEITKKVLDTKKNAKAVTETFYVALFEDKAHKKMIGSPIAIPFQNQDTASVKHTLKVTAGTAEYYAAETDQQGAVLTSGNENYDFAIGFEDHATKDATGKLTVVCGQTTKFTVTNTLSKAVVQMKVTDASGKLLTGAELVIKNAQGRVVSINGTVVFRSEGKAIEWKGVLPEGSYYLSEVNAPSGYLPTPDVAFTVETGKTTEVIMTNQKREGGSSMTVGLQVYEGQHLLYAQDTTTGTYAAEGRYTRYAALFSDAEHTRKVSNVQKITATGFLGSTEFKNLVQGSTYYLAETDQYGQVLTSDSVRKLQYTKSGTSTISGASEQMVISEIYTGLPRGFRYTARLTLEKQVVDSSGAPKAVTGSFYIGIFRTSDYSDTPTLVRLDLNNASSASVSKRILLSGTSDVTYYFAEVDQAGRRIANSADFSYTPSVDKPQITLTRSSDQKVIVVNKEKVSKVTLYLTKRVYEGTELKPVTATFYAGLFKDPQFTQLYANPIPMQLNNSSSVTLKLSLNLGTANEATVYVAEVDQNGKVVQSGEAFGYDIRVVNSTAAFTQENTEIQTILLNSVYGSVDDSGWRDILSQPDNNVGGHTGGGGYGGGGYVSQNGENSAAGTGSVQTGDTTPWTLYLVLFAVSGAGLLFFGYRKRRTGK